MTWNDVTIEHFAEIQKILEDEPKTQLDVHNTKVLIAEVLTGKTVEQIDSFTTLFAQTYQTNYTSVTR